jgi:hypothetical protein
MTRKRVLWALVLVAALGIAVAWYVRGPRAVPPGQPPLATLSPSALEALRADFNRAAGQVRVIILLSPT